VPIFIGRGAPATLMRDLDCLPKIKSKAHHRLISPLRALGVAVSLRQALIAVSNTMLVQQGQQTKMEQVYHYLTGTKFKQRVDAVIEKFNDMRDDLDKERKFMTRQWSKRKTLILSVVESTVGMVGDLQAIAGKAMPEIPGLDLPLLERSDAAE
jgi:hypothetical protein